MDKKLWTKTGKCRRCLMMAQSVMTPALPELPPGLVRAPDQPAKTLDSYETRMRHHVRAGDQAAALKIWGEAPPERNNAHMINMALSAMIATGMSVADAATDALNTCARFGVHPTKEIFNNILGELSRSGAPASTIYLCLQSMRQAGLRPDTCACNILLKAHLQASDFEGAARLLAAMMASTEAAAATPPPPPAELPRPLAFGRNLSVDSCVSEVTVAIDCLDDDDFGIDVPASPSRCAVPSPPVPPPPDEVGSSSSAATPRASPCVADVYRLPPPDAISFNMTIVALGLAHQPQQGEALMHRMIGMGFYANQTTFTTVINAYAKAAKPADAARILEYMLSAGVPPDDVAINTVLAAYARAGDHEGCKRLLVRFENERARQAGGAGAGGGAGGGAGADSAGASSSQTMPPNPQTPRGAAGPDLISYNTLILACANAACPHEAEVAFSALTARGLQPSQVSYSTVLVAHARAGHVVAAQAWLDKMRHAGISPDALSYNTLCSAHARVGDVQNALTCLREMEDAGVEVTPTTRSIMIHALVTSGKLEVAEEALRGFVATGTGLTASCFNTLISAHGKARRPKRAEALFECMEREADVRPTLVTFNTLANAHALVGDLGSVERVVARLTEAGLRPDKYTFGALLQASANSRDAETRQRAASHVERLLRSPVTLNDFLVSACKRAIGEASFVSLQRKHAATARADGGGGEGGGGGGGGGGGSPATAAAAAHSKDADVGPHAAEATITRHGAGEADEWVTQKSRRCRQHWSSGLRHNGSSASAASTKSDPTTRVSPIRKSAHVASRKDPSGKPMRRSAGSELALCLGEEMKIE